MLEPRLVRSQRDRMIGGVCGGLATYLGIDSTLVRLAFLLLIPASGIGVVLYLILLVITPAASAGDEGYHDSSAEEMGSGTAVKKGADPKGAHPKGAHPKGAHPKGAHQKGAHPQGPTIAGILLVLLGIYLLFDLSRISWLLWPLLLVGLGVYLIWRRR
jgi:phage shock protein C